jgi:enoyl-CoA hydratase/carnithine racemase
MQFVQASNKVAIRILKLSRNKANALNQPMEQELMEEARTSPNVCALVFGSAQSRFFSAGFDVREVFDYDPTSCVNSSANLLTCMI